MQFHMAAGHEFCLPTKGEIEESMRARSAAPTQRQQEPVDAEE